MNAGDRICGESVAAPWHWAVVGRVSRTFYLGCTASEKRSSNWLHRRFYRVMLPRPLETTAGVCEERSGWEEGGRDSTTWARPTDYDGIASPCVGERKFLVRRWRVGMARPGKRSGPGRRCRPHPAWCGDVGCRIALQHGAVLDVLPAGHHWASGFGRRPASLAVATKLQHCSFPCLSWVQNLHRGRRLAILLHPGLARKQPLRLISLASRTHRVHGQRKLPHHRH